LVTHSLSPRSSCSANGTDATPAHAARARASLLGAELADIVQLSWYGAVELAMNDAATASLIPQNPDRVVVVIFLPVPLTTQLFRMIKWDPEFPGSQNFEVAS
jgi:hypothetical protein